MIFSLLKVPPSGTLYAEREFAFAKFPLVSRILPQRGIKMTRAEEQFLSRLEQFIPDFTPQEKQMQQLRIFYENLIEWNKVMNLTAITEEEDVYTKHFLDSYSILTSVPRETLEQDAGAHLIDVGTGAGFPGIPIAIAFPELQVTLMDSLNKRINFLKDTIEKCGLKNVICIHSRAEELGKNKEHRERYDYAVSRAVANLSTLNEYCLPFVKVGGRFIAYKGDKVADEMPAGKKAAEILGAKLTREFSFYLPETDYRRTILTFVKKRETPKKFPRKAGTPAKEPIA